MSDDRIINIAKKIELGEVLNSRDCKFWIKSPISLRRGIFDGFSSVTFNNPIHNNWKKDKSGKVIHFDKHYLKGYKLGYLEKSNIRPFCFGF